MSDGAIADSTLERGLSALHLSKEPGGRVGCRARAARLEGRPELNGRRGCIDAWNAARGRYVFEMNGSGEQVLLRPEKLDPDDVVTELLDNDRQPRDWPHRAGCDPPASFASLWRTPIVPNSQGAVESPACQCGRRLCKCPDRSYAASPPTHQPARTRITPATRVCGEIATRLARRVACAQLWGLRLRPGDLLALFPRLLSALRRRRAHQPRTKHAL